MLDHVAQFKDADPAVEPGAPLGFVNWEAPPVRIHPKGPGDSYDAAVLGGPDPESSVVSPLLVSYARTETSRISNREAMWYPGAQAVSARLP
ncbi:MAG: hypothetical protein E6J75_03215 [Deltaproteobacteria bacterium]|nr:MAG: hypothetical protein E6J79_04570 [Deltaproteobacteria bacterium]TMA59433.1 MAG: hypothetical protein E6J75_03215 [Deltaproteobacteria bacterium]